MKRHFKLAPRALTQSPNALAQEYPLWVIRDQPIQRPDHPLSVVTPKADKRRCEWNVR
jgi:hypothetical protein